MKTKRPSAPSGKLVAFGEVLLRLAPAGAERLVQATRLDLSFAGAEINAAVAAAAWGLPSRFVTALPANPWADIVAAHLRYWDVELASLLVANSRLGVYFFENGAGSRPARVIYDRAGSAFAVQRAARYRWSEFFRGGSWFHTSGITPALSAEARRACALALRAARRAGLRTSFDLNYRRTLWPPREAGPALRRLVVGVDLLLGAEDVLVELLDASPVGVMGPDGRPRADAAEALCREVADRYRVRAVALSLRHTDTDGGQSLAGCLYDGRRTYFSRTHTLDVVDRLGGGDALAGVLIAGLERSRSPDQALEEAVAAAALKHTTIGDFLKTSPDEVRAWLAGAGRGRVLR